MDIIDILLASASTPEGQAGIAAAEAKTAAAEAKTAAQNAATAAQDATEIVQQVITTIGEINNSESSDENKIAYTFQTPDNTIIIKHYKSAGENEDGTMTQKAIKAYIDSIPSGGGNLGPENAGSVVSVGEDGQITPSPLSEESVIRTEILVGTYTLTDAVGLEIDYKNKTFTRVQSSKGLTPGEDFNKYSMYGNIRRCLVDDNGEIIAFYGDPTYVDNYASGYQTMVYIPKFYYIRIPYEVENNAIIKETIIISGHNQEGYLKLHPAFINENGDEIDYFLYSAYEGSTFDVSANAYNRNDGEIDFTEDKLASIVEAKPISGVNNELTRENAEQLAQNRGEGWHITSIQAVSAIQMLSLIEYGTFNLRSVIERGISDIENVVRINCSSYTGSTKDLGNESGHANSTINERNGIEYTYNENGKRAISYRGIENLYGNIWNYIGNLEIRGDGDTQGGVPYIYNFITKQYESAGFMLPNTSNWISRFGYKNEKYDWLFIPSASDNSATSALPVGCYLWVSKDLNGVRNATLGGHWNFADCNGAFYYGFDRTLQYSDRGYGVRMMYLPRSKEE